MTYGRRRRIAAPARRLLVIRWGSVSCLGTTDSTCIGGPRTQSSSSSGLVLAVLGVYNIVLKATWTVMDDGVLWRSSPQGLVAARIAPDGPAARAGIQARRRPARDRRRRGAERRAPRAGPGRPPLRGSPHLLAAAPAREALARPPRPAGAPGQRRRLLLPLARRLLQPRGRDRRHAAPACRPHRAALLRGVRALLPRLLHLLHGQARRDRLDLRLDATTSRRSSCPSSTCTSASPSPSAACGRSAPGSCRRSTCRPSSSRARAS